MAAAFGPGGERRKTRTGVNPPGLGAALPAQPLCHQRARAKPCRLARLAPRWCLAPRLEQDQLGCADPALMRCYPTYAYRAGAFHAGAPGQVLALSEEPAMELVPCQGVGLLERG